MDEPVTQPEAAAEAEDCKSNIIIIKVVKFWEYHVGLVTSGWFGPGPALPVHCGFFLGMILADEEW